MKWEIKTYGGLMGDNVFLAEKYANEIANDGWEPFAIDDHGTMYFKRPMKDDRMQEGT